MSAREALRAYRVPASGRHEWEGLSMRLLILGVCIVLAGCGGGAPVEPPPEYPLVWLLILLVVVGSWIAFIYFTGRVAADRGHDPGVWYLAAILLGPLALVAALASPFTPDVTAAAIARAMRTSAAQRPAFPAAAPAATQNPTAGHQGTIYQPREQIRLGRWRVHESEIARLPVQSIVDVVLRDGRVALLSSAYVGRTISGQWRGNEEDGDLLLFEGSATMLRLRPIEGPTAIDAASVINNKVLAP